MSSYLTFYLVPKKTRKKYHYDSEKGHTEEEVKISEGKPLALMSFSRNNEIYRAFHEVLNITYIGIEEKYKYSEITLEDAEKVVASVKEDVESTEKWLKNKAMAFNTIEKPDKEAVEDYLSEYASMNDYLQEQKETLHSVESIRDMIANMEYCDFEQKLLANVD